MSQVDSDVRRIPTSVNSSLDYWWDWTDWLADAADTIASVQITAQGPLVKVGSATVVGGKVTQVISGGEAGQEYLVTCKITTASKGLVDERSILLHVVQR